MTVRTAREQYREVVRRMVRQALHAQSIREVAPDFPSNVHIEPTNSCNLRCVHCHHQKTMGPSRYTRKLGLMSMDLYAKVIEEIRTLSTAVTLDVQGEPLLHPHILDMVALAKENGLYVSILTNATRLTPETTQRLLELGLDRVVFSFDAADKDIYESIRVGSTFEPTLRNILGFIRRNHESGHHCHVCMSMVLQSRNKEHAEAYRRYFESLPVDKVFLNPMLNLAGVAGTKDEIDLDARPQDRADWPVCRVPWEDITVNWDGLVCPCPVDVNVVRPVGDANTESLADIWNNEQMRAFRRAHMEHDYSFIEQNGPLCGSCNCMFDTEYDLRAFADFAVEALVRQAVHFAPQLLAEGAGTEDSDDQVRYDNLVKALEVLD